ncbi:MAG: O-antigen polymerase [Candidatus Nanopelagicales bacterium]
MLPVRPVLLCTYLAMALIAVGGFLAPLTLLTATAVLTTASIFARLAESRTLSLPAVWEVGFLAIIFYDARTTMLDDAGFQCINPGAAASLLVVGHCMAVAAMDLFGAAGGSARTPRKPGATLSRPVVWAVWTVGVIYLVPVAAQAAEVGRVAVSQNQDGPIAALFKAVGMVAPTLVALSVKGEPRTRLIKAYLYSAPILLAQVTLGTRYFLLCAAVAPMLAVYGPRFSGARAVMRYGVLALTLVLTASVMLALRSVGILARSDAAELQVGLSAEGIMGQTCDLVEYFGINHHLGGSSGMSVAVVLFPRALWADKPVLIDYWFPREFGGRLFGETNSVATAYVGDGYADFGITGVALYSVIFGLLVGYGQRVVDSAWLPDSGTARKALSSLLFPIVFFGVRSPVTALVNVVGFCTVLGLAQLLSGNLRKPPPSLPAPEAVPELVSRK